MASNKVSHLDTANFAETLKTSTTPILVDFWAEWCGPCRAIAPMLEELAGEYDGKLKIAKVNIDDNHELAIKYSIRNIPTMLLFKDGNVAETLVGALPKGQLKSAIERVLSA